MSTRHISWFLYSILAILLSFGNAAEQQPLQAVDATPRKVAIIGAGAGGSFAAYELRKLADEADTPVEITVYERESYVGGRSTTVNVFDDPAYPIELGASIFVQVNYNLVNASRDLGLTVRSADYARPRETDKSIGIWDGSQFVFSLKNTYSWWNIGRLFWRYGLAPLRTQNLVKKIVGQFLRLYEEPLFPFSSLSEAAVAAELLNATSSSGEAFLHANDVGSLFAREIIQASTRVNYGQNLHLIHGLESIVCMATDGAVSIEGGNWRIFDAALSASHAHVNVNTTVVGITRNDDGTVQVSSKLNAASTSEETFDEVVVAGPLQYSGISISPSLDHTPDKIPYVDLHVTLFSSPRRIAPQYFGLDTNVRVPETILTTLPEDFSPENLADVGPSGFWSISTLRTVDHSPVDSEETQRHYVYKIFSPERPTAEFIASILGLEKDATSSNATIGDLSKSDISWFHEKLWNPYPVLYPRVTFEDTLLAPGVWYTGGIESFISTMETSALMGRNVAMLMFQSWQKQTYRMNNEAFADGKTEL